MSEKFFRDKMECFLNCFVFVYMMKDLYILNIDDKGRQNNTTDIQKNAYKMKLPKTSLRR